MDVASLVRVGASNMNVPYWARHYGVDSVAKGLLGSEDVGVGAAPLERLGRFLSVS